MTSPLGSAERTLAICVLALFSLVACVRPVAAQAQAQAPAPPPPPPPPAPILAGWQDGFFLQSVNGDYRLTLGMTAQADGRFSLVDPPPFTDTFTLRKIRPTFTGRLTKFFEFKIMPDLGSGQMVMQDAYLDIRFVPTFRIRMGKDKEPVGYELLIADPYVLFPERSLATNLVPNRDDGVQAIGEFFTGRLLYSVGVFNGIPDGTSTTTEIDTNNPKDLLGRVVVLPFRTRTPVGPLNGLGFHVGASAGQQLGALPSYKTSGTQVFYTYGTGVSADGSRERVSPAVFYYYKRFGGFAEYMSSAQGVTRLDTHAYISNTGWDVTGSYVLTGETTTDRGVRPRDNFDPSLHHWGALQLLARYAVLSVDQAAFDLKLAAATASRVGHQTGIGANWYPNYWIKYYVEYEQTTFDGGAERPTEHAIIFRAQLAF